MLLAHYGKDGTAMCCWPGCGIIDPDMLTLDHIHGGGTKHRKQCGAGNKFLNWIVRSKFPAIFQTLCWNHQWKKRLAMQQSDLAEIQLQECDRNDRTQYKLTY